MARSIQEQTGVDPAQLGEEIPLAPPATEAAEETPERPEWLDPKFESVEAQAQAYMNAQREMSRAQDSERRTQELLESLAAERNEPQPTPEAQPQQMDQFTLMQKWQEAVEMGDAQQMLAINAFVAQQAAQQAAKEIVASQPQPQQQSDPMNSELFAYTVRQQAAEKFGEEWSDLEPEVAGLLQEYPHLLPDSGNLAQTVEALTMVGEMARARRGATAQAAADAGRQQKMLAQGVTGSAGRPATQQVNAADHLADLMKRV